MVTVEDIISLAVFDRVWLACPCEGYETRPVTNCGTLDYEPFFDDYNVFVPGEFIFTTLGFAKADPALAEDAVLKIIERNVAALAIKPVAMKSVTERIAQASLASGVPILFYDGRYLERIITEAMNLIDKDSESSRTTAMIDALLAPADDNRVRNLIFQIAGATGSAFQCIALEPLQGDKISARALKGALDVLLAEYASQFAEVESYSTCLYDGTVLGFVSFSRQPQTVITITEANLCHLTEQLGDVHCGLSQELPLEEGDLSIRQALAALNTAKAEGVHTLRWSELRLDAFHAAASTDRLFARTSQHIYDLLDEHDRSHGSELHATADAFALSFGEVKATSEALFQHPNTVRYRIKKVKEAIGAESLTDKELASLLVMAYIAQQRI